VNNDDIVYNNTSLKDIYTQWYSKKMEKVSIATMLNKLKVLNPNVTLVALQEFPADLDMTQKLRDDLETNVGGTLFLNEELFVIDSKVSATRGAIFVYNDVVDNDIDPNIYNNPEALIVAVNKFPLKLCGLMTMIIAGIIVALSFIISAN
jgi:hypothetical protein